ncbi:MAG TPA: glutamate 5-kinase [Caulobacteraceae bacterium]|nr:glutamate 5-kinase [Caulobacteraceae bacterium]
MVVKVGSALATAADGQPDRGWIAALAADLARLTRRRQKVVVVSSGAVALGRARLGLTRRRLSLAQKQAAAAAGQSRLMRAWEEALEPEGLVAAQVLLTPDDTEVRRRFLNARATLEALLELGVTPIVNENDTVATEELRYGDNDRLAARVAQMIGAELLVLLSDVDGLYSADPRSNPRARHIPEVGAITAEVEAMAGVADAAAGIGSGGMVTKLAAARIAAAAGCATIISLGRRAAPLAAIEAGERATVFTPALTPAAAYKAWIAGALSPQGVLVVDDGAVAALRAGKSLLAAGVRSAEGGFGKGETVIVRDRLGREIGRGLCRYDAPEARRILGLRSAEIEALLGYAGGPLIHADDMALAAGAA